MSRKTYVDVKTDVIKGVLDEVIAKPGREATIIPVVVQYETFAPTKKKPNHRIKFEIAVAPDAFRPEFQTVPITNFGSMIILNVDRNKINPQYLDNEGED